MESVKEKSSAILHIVYHALESSLNGIFITNLKSRIVYANTSALNLLGYAKKKELVGHPVSSIFHQEPIQTLKDIYVILKSTEHKTLRLPLLTQQGKSVLVEMAVSNVYNKEKRIIGKMASILDLTANLALKKNLVKAESRIHHLSSKILETEEKQRKIMARELHDAVGSNLAAVKLALESRKEAFNDPSHAIPLSQIIHIIEKTMDEIHAISRNLSPAILDKLGLKKAIESLCREIARIHPSIRIDCTMDFHSQDIPEPLKIVLYRIIQEALNNAVKHSHGPHVQVMLKADDEGIDLEIADNGQGFDLTQAFADSGDPSRGLGLQSMQERTEWYGGHFEIFSEEHKGTRIRSVWPMKNESRPFP
ncbi:MAG: PAS domain S-box protein [Proteobacteria bacterium]|nr:PAS domain S-box protein [Pseudomonadota bacterium]